MSNRDFPVGAPLPDWTPPPAPDFTRLEGRTVRLERLDPDAHGAGLFDAYRAAADAGDWAYLPYGPFDDRATFDPWLVGMAAKSDPRFYTICVADSGAPRGLLSLMRIAPEAGSIEVGHIHFAPELQGTAGATEAIWLCMNWVFSAGYRRFEWKCDALNARSRNAAARFGFTYEGTFRQAGIVKGRNRDTAWFAIIDRDWPALAYAYRRWLSPENFDSDGRQRQSLRDLTAPIVSEADTDSIN
ncbi:GNAT family N-acetyltransferase [Oceanomicrobium pacificus]|uniref:GNAT family N-acetyltransferase n=1 Tax=Oceanomicrobium pacificus TaxID=2692916 RepID=A0A6B0TSV9_9RHOB|nr:GNAT family protein [Oceanomicrobium pacificus]MXU64083.1 GNAT family N-acetyltransferase [Oceanomicrobium pacificus]